MLPPPVERKPPLKTNKRRETTTSHDIVCIYSTLTHKQGPDHTQPIRTHPPTHSNSINCVFTSGRPALYYPLYICPLQTAGTTKWQSFATSSFNRAARTDSLEAGDEHKTHILTLFSHGKIFPGKLKKIPRKFENFQELSTSNSKYFVAKRRVGAKWVVTANGTFRAKPRVSL